MTSQPIATDRLLDVEEVRAKLGHAVSAFWVGKAGREGILARTRVANRYRYPESSVDAYIAAQTTPAVVVGRTSRSAAASRRRRAA